MPKFDHSDDPAAEIYFLHDYVPWSWHQLIGGGAWDGDSSRILDLKKSKPTALAYYENKLAAEISKPYKAICAVPSHDPDGSDEKGVRLLAKRLADRLGMLDGRAFLRRTVKVQKLTGGGSRALSVHTGSCEAKHAELFAGGRILLLDDVITSGNSLLACRNILLAAGASEVICVALGRTKH